MIGFVEMLLQKEVVKKSHSGMNHSEIPLARIPIYVFSARNVGSLPQIPTRKCMALLIVTCMLERAISKLFP